MDDEFYRIKRLPPYVIAEVNGMRAAARTAGRDIIDLGVGDPDLPTPPHIIEALHRAALDPANILSPGHYGVGDNDPLVRP